MTASNMYKITASLENFSLNNHHHHHRSSGASSGGESSSSSDQMVVTTDYPRRHTSESSSDDTTLELNSHVSQLPYHWEQCLDLKTGEIYYINWRNGMTTKEDPMKIQDNGNRGFFSEEEEGDSSYDSDESSSGSSLSPSRNLNPRSLLDREEIVLVVAGCKRCYMYFMVPKRLQGCPRCNSRLIHFDGSQNGCP